MNKYCFEKLLNDLCKNKNQREIIETINNNNQVVLEASLTQIAFTRCRHILEAVKNVTG